MILFGVAALAIDIWCGPQSRFPTMPVPRRKGGVNTAPSKVVTRPDAPASMNADRLVDRIRLLEAKDGDLIVVTIDERISMDTANRIQIMFEDVIKAIGRKAKVVVLDKGMDIKVVRTSELEQAHPDAAWYVHNKAKA
jgi:hypothetical protein